MSQQFYVRLPQRGIPSAESQFEWIARDEGGRLSQSTIGEVGELKRRIGESGIIFVMDASLVRGVTANIPGRSEQQVEQAAPYALEEDIASEIECNDVSVGAARKSGKREVSIIDRDYLDGLFLIFKAADIRIDHLISEASLLPLEPSSVTVLVDEDRILTAFEDSLGTAIEIDAAPLLLKRIYNKHQPSRVNFYYTSALQLSDPLRDALEDSVVESSSTWAAVERDAFSWLVNNGETIQGEAKNLDLIPPRHRIQASDQQNARLLKIAAGIFALAFVIHLTLGWLDIRRGEQDLARIKSQQEVEFRRGFPEINRLVNAEAQSGQALSALQAEGPPPATFLEILHRSGAALQTAEFEVELVGLTFADGVLLLRTESAEMDQLEKYHALLTTSSDAEVVTAEASGDIVRGALRLKVNTP